MPKYAIYPEKQSTPTTTSANSSYPVANLTGNDYRKKVWKAASSVATATLRVPIAANAQAISLHNTNAETAICTITLDSAEQTLKATLATSYASGTEVGISIATHGYSENDIILLNGTDHYDGVYTLPSQASGATSEVIITATFATETFAITDTACVVVESTTHTLETTDRTYDRFWQAYTKQIAAHTATIKLTAGSGETVEAGIVRAGTLATFSNPQYGASQSPRDFSIKKPLRNGAIYTKKLEIVRAYSYSMDLVRDTKFNDLIDLYSYYGPNPFCMLIDDEIDNDYWCLFGAFDSEPQGSHSYPSDSVVSVSILESV